ncbi:hypothetical protein EJB05_36398, partial [Eragrostis curvula]
GTSVLASPPPTPGTALQIRRPVASSPRVLPPQSTALIPSAVSVSVSVSKKGDTKGSKSSDQTAKKEILLNGEPGSSFDGF